MVQEEQWDSQISWGRAHTTEKQRETMTQFGQYVTLGSDKAEKVAQTEAGCDGAVFAEVVAKDALAHRQHVYAAIRHTAKFHYRIAVWKDVEVAQEREIVMEVCAKEKKRE